MMGKTHMIIGVTAAVMVAPTLELDIPTSLLCIVAAGVGSLFPDIDHPNSKIRQYIPVFLPLKHRGLTHSLLGLLGVMFLVSILITPLPPAAITPAAFFIIGWLFHILADMVTNSGVMLFYPSNRNIRLLPKAIAIRTGSSTEYIIAALVGLLAIYQLFKIFIPV